MHSTSNKAVHLFSAVVPVGGIGIAGAKANGATDDEIREAVATAAITRHWSTVLNGMQIDLATFKSDPDTVLDAAGKTTKQTHWGDPNARR